MMIAESKFLRMERVRIGEAEFMIRIIKGLRLVSRKDFCKHLSEKGTLDRLVKSGRMTAFFENGTPKKVRSTSTTYYDLNEWLKIDYNKN